MTLTQTKNHTNWNTVQNEKYACMVVFPTLSFLCLAGLIVVLSYMYISINKQNRKLDADNAAIATPQDSIFKKRQPPRSTFWTHRRPLSLCMRATFPKNHRKSLNNNVINHSEPTRGRSPEHGKH